MGFVLVTQLPETAAYADSRIRVLELRSTLESRLVVVQGIGVFAEGEESSGLAHDGHHVATVGGAQRVLEAFGGLAEGIEAFRLLSG
jgi:hypothetical protein